MKTFLRIFLGLTALVLLAQGAAWAFVPEFNMVMNGIQVNSPLGLNMVKSDIGGGLLAAGAFLALYALKGGHWFYPTAIVAGSYAGVRLVSCITDGWDPLAAFGVGLEILVVLAAWALRRQGW